MPDGRSQSELLLQVWMLKLKEVEQVAEEIVEDVSLVHLSHCVPIYGCRWEPQTQPLRVVYF